MKPIVRKLLAITICAISLPSCAQMSQQKSGQTGAAIGAAVGGAGVAAVAKHQGARGSDLVGPALLGGLAGAAVGASIGESTGMKGVYRTEVPNQ